MGYLMLNQTHVGQCVGLSKINMDVANHKGAFDQNGFELKFDHDNNRGDSGNFKATNLGVYNVV